MSPPRFADRLLKLFCAPHRLEETLGDLHEEFVWQVQRIGERRARWRYWWDVLGFIKPFAIKREPQKQSNPSNTAMLRNYLKIAWRVLITHRTYSSLNITGLAVGLATTLLILLWINDELSVDQFHTHHQQIHQIRLNLTPSAGETVSYESVPMPIADAMKKEVAGVVRATRFSWGEEALFSYQDKTSDERGHYADPDFLHMFSFPLLKGDTATALTEPNTLLITQTLAEKYFGQENPIGKLIRLDKTTDYKVVGILANIPANSSLRFDFLRPMREPLNAGSWMANNFQVFAMLAPGVDSDQINARLQALTRRHVSQYKDRTYILHPLDNWHLRTDFKNGQYAGGGRITYVRLFGIVALLILLIACINFVNLSTARATQRAKEVGVRKSIGADKQSLIGQFLGESFLLTFIAGLLALGFVVVALPFFNQLLEKPFFNVPSEPRITIDWSNPLYYGAYAGVLLLTSLLAGFYPAFVLSSFQPVKVLKGLTDQFTGRSGVWLRQSLVVVQFVASFLLIVGTAVVYQQISYIRNKNLGYNRSNVVYFNMMRGIQGDHLDRNLQEFAAIPGVQGVTVANTDFLGVGQRMYPDWPGKPANETIETAILTSDYSLLPTMGIRLKAGRNFSRAFSTDTANVLLNEVAVRRFRFRHPIGQQITVSGQTGIVIGVVNDFHLQTLHAPIEPLIIRYQPNHTELLFARIDRRHMPATLQAMEKTFKSITPGFPFTYNFLDKSYEWMYRSELQIGKLANWLAGLSIFIACLGLLGLATFTVERRTKEIGIRKVLGASLTQIFTLISKEFVVLVLIALLLAFYPARYLMNTWLSQFAYHITVGWWLFALTGLLVVGIALLTVSAQSMKAALMNPVKSLRSE